uniref:Uncharacterized protein n=1 Tax=Cyanoderma ruficeps TaxID=181631 RepID=A0A8C3NU40_9PASS
MDNVLIDDRRIHVDFSQSIAKMRWKGKGGRYTKEDFKDYEKEHLKEKVKPKQDAKHDLVLEEDVGECHTSQSHLAKKQKKKKHHHSEDNEKRTKTLKYSDGKHEEHCGERTKGEKKDSPATPPLLMGSGSHSLAQGGHLDRERDQAWEKERDQAQERERDQGHSQSGSRGRWH